MSLIDLFIIDDADMSNVITSILANQNSRIGKVTCFTNAQKALDRIKNDALEGNKLPDLILLDIHMPELDGYEWIDEIDEEFDDFKPVVVLVSGTNRQKDFESLKKQKLAKELIGKPITKEVIERLITENFG